MSANFYEIDEILNEAVMTGVPSIILEGIDDIEIYTRIAESANFQVEFYAVESIDGYGQGCDNVIAAVTDLNSIVSEKYKLENNVLGIIDKDVRDFRQELPSVEPMLVLNYYSIESHFVSKFIVESILDQCVKATRDILDDTLCKVIMDEIETKLLDIYYFSLESLKNALEPEYLADFSYSMKPGRLNDFKLKSTIYNKRDDLDKFAASKALTPCLNTLKIITKGKWLIDAFAIELINSIEGLKDKCRSHQIKTCKSCVIDAYDKCFYRIKDGFNKNTIVSLACTNVIGDEFNYIVDRINMIKKSA
ncbi:hypothetical protein [Shewanella frigidimarina]|uniref:hypothetical protein n=1 Tax=Shewanella frigidimarina TaxID=56812 RepID=UPI003D7A28F6